MKEINKMIVKLQKSMPVLSRTYCVKSLSIFGSYTRAEQRTKSDIDILVEFSKTIDLFQFMELEGFLSDLLGIKVDLVMKDTLKPRIRDRILKEAMSV